MDVFFGGVQADHPAGLGDGFLPGTLPQPTPLGRIRLGSCPNPGGRTMSSVLTSTPRKPGFSVFTMDLVPSAFFISISSPAAQDHVAYAQLVRNLAQAHSFK